MIVFFLHLAATMFFFHVPSNAKAQEFRGAFHALNYLKPAVPFSVPILVFLEGVSILVGEWTLRPVVVFLLSIAIVILDAYFLWEWTPSCLGPRINRALILVDPAGFRWLNETWFKLDRGVRFYNSALIPPDASFLVSRSAFVVTGLGAVGLARRLFAATLRGRRAGLKPAAVACS